MLDITKEIKKIKLLEEWMGNKPGTIITVGGFLGLFPVIADDLIERSVAEEIKESAKKK